MRPLNEATNPVNKCPRKTRIYHFLILTGSPRHLWAKHGTTDVHKRRAVPPTRITNLTHFTKSMQVWDILHLLFTYCAHAWC